ncbi:MULTISPECIES: IS1182 family transposase [unclassified Bradyrhizobium]|uniref:IS1182 family transposase n=1 Tax=unclassified Bradyrhizobium TaxID=2631580 RepID=UPI00247B199A|nr:MULTISPECIES: IS1182 family transposase [unclassified Bradyrhizobium]WGS18559.1 IS1182 family transposase [Bradyrhizobium sp. ISRA463]WGS25383.1 IS1182 family transposase [Bradyrhizobium sp. ISRA464]
MMGPRQIDQAALFYEFSLERHVPAAHLLRAIDRFVDLSDVRSHLAPFYGSTGRPSIDPELLVRMLLVGYCYGIRSERRLCEEVHLILAYRWFCRLGLGGEVPDHSIFSKNRHGRFRDCDLLRKLFETVVRRCMAEGLVDGAAFAVDASLIAADANKQRSVAGSDEVDWEAVARTRRSVREYLDTLDKAAWGAASETVPKFISKSDPAAQWTGAHKGHAFFAYANNYLIDLKVAIIVDVEATRAIRQAEVGAARTMIERTEEHLDLCPGRLAADSAYASAEMLGWLVNERAIEPHIPVFDKSAHADVTFSREAFAYDQQSDVYICPAGKVLTATGTLVHDGATLLYRAIKHVCDACELKPRCCPKTPARKVARSIHEMARDVAREIAKTDAYVRSRCERKKIETLFAHLKRILRLDRLRLSGPLGARDELLLAATAQNLRKLAKLIPLPSPRSSPPKRR